MKQCICRYCNQIFVPTAAQLKSYNYLCMPCRYKYVQKKYNEKHTDYNREWLRMNRETINPKRRIGGSLARPKQKEYARLQLALRNKIIQDAKNKPCMDCGKQYIPFAMHFDHRDPSTKFRSISQMGTYSILRIKTEIEKCDVVCATCHAIRTWAGIKSGRISAFGRKPV